MTFRMARQFGSHIPLTDNRCYRVETEELLTAEEARELMAQLGSPYGSERPKQEERPVEAAAFRRLVKYVEEVLEKAASELEAGRDF